MILDVGVGEEKISRVPCRFVAWWGCHLLRLNLSREPDSGLILDILSPTCL